MIGVKAAFFYLLSWEIKYRKSRPCFGVNLALCVIMQMRGPTRHLSATRLFLASLDKRVLMWGVAAAMGGGLEDLRVLRGRVGSRYAGRERQ